MGGISDAHVEWAIVNRLKAMLDDPPQTQFNVTQTFALFSSILMWSKNRAWVAGKEPTLRTEADANDRRAHRVREALGEALITDAPWQLSTIDPKIIIIGAEPDRLPGGDSINSDFENMKAAAFFNWLRDAIAHGDARTITPICKISQRTGASILIGFKFVYEEQYRAKRKLTLFLYHDDMRRLGSNLADLFCQSLSGGDQYFEKEAGAARFREAKTAA